MTERQFYRPDELATAMGESLDNIYRWIRKGKIKVVRLDRKIWIRRAEFNRIVHGEPETLNK